jgi:two-component system, OmpR family, sensor kinase
VLGTHYDPDEMEPTFTIDDVLLRRFGWVRAVGGGAYIVAVLVLWALLGSQVWPLALGVPVLAVVTTAYFVQSVRYPRTSVIASLIADALVLGGAVAYLGGTGSGMVMIYSIVVVSAGILLGPAAAMGFTTFTMGLGALQLVFEQIGFEPALLALPPLETRLPVFLVSLAGLASVGYLTANYASRLHELIAEAGHEAEAVRVRGRRRRSFVRQASADVRRPLGDLEAVADELEEAGDGLSDPQRRRLAARLRIGVTMLEAEVALLADVGSMDESAEARPEPVLLSRAVEDCIVGLGDRLHGYVVDLDLGPIKVVGDRRATRRVVFNLLENVVEHTPVGTTVRVQGRTTAHRAVLILTDDGPGVPSELAGRLFAPPDKGGGPRVGLPLVRELCESMGAEVRHEPAPHGGARFFVSFRLAPSGAPSADDEPTTNPTT